MDKIQQVAAGDKEIFQEENQGIETATKRGEIMAYFPNGCAGMFLDEQCEECIIGIENPCPVALMQLEYNYKQFDKEGKPTEMSKLMNIFIDKGGKCLMLKELKKTKHFKYLIKLAKRLK